MFKRLFVLVLLAIATVSVRTPTLAATGPAPIRPQSEWIYHTYYSDATYTEQVGYKIENECTGRTWVSGMETPYYKTTWYWCYA